MVVSILLAVIAVAVLIIVFMIVRSVRSKKSDSGNGGSKNRRERSSIVKDAEKKLAHDPHNVNALTTLGELYFSEKNWEKTWNIYKTLYDISAAHIDVDMVKSALRMGIAAYQLGRLDDAISSLMVAMKKDPQNYETAYYLGVAMYKNGTYDKAIYCLRRAHDINPSSGAVNEPLGISYFKAQKYKDSLPFLKRCLDLQPDNKEVMYCIAVAMTETGLGDKALKIFMHLRPDPEYGPKSCIEAGRIHEKTKNYELAIQDYEIGLKLPNVPEQNLMQIKYKIALSYIATKNISKGLSYLKQIQNSHPGYKDVDALVARYSELNQNSNLQIYLLSGTSEFVALCRKFISVYYPKAIVKFEDVSVQSESVEVLCSVQTEKMEDREIFRFYRNSSVIGDIQVREFHSKIRDLKCDRGFCVTMTSFSEPAHKFIDGRPIDFIEKDKLIQILKKINLYS